MREYIDTADKANAGVKNLCICISKYNNRIKDFYEFDNNWERIGKIISKTDRKRLLEKEHLYINYAYNK